MDFIKVDTSSSFDKPYLYWYCCIKLFFGRPAAMESSIEAMEKRHETEQAQLLITTKAMMKSAKKSEKTVVEARCIQMQYDLKANQSAEIDDLLERIGLYNKWLCSWNCNFCCIQAMVLWCKRQQPLKKN